MASIDVARIRTLLEAQIADLHRQVDELDVANEAAADFDENFADSGQVAAEQGENLVLVNQFRDQIAEAEQALVRLGDGTYGRCQVCDAAIAPARLEALPATRFCIDHA